MERTGRLVSLDGLRGVAALVVVVFHVVISTPRAGAIYKLENTSPLTPWEFALNYSPLRVLWAGSEAVVVFYVLSGLVLTLPFVRGDGVPWRLFYPRRLVRLYLPAVASLVFAWFTTVLITRTVIPGASSWLNWHAEEGRGWRQVLLGSSLMAGWGSLNTSLWSLRWEVAFSLLLPVFLYLALRLTRLFWVKAIAVVVFTAAWPLYGFFYPDLVYIAVFGLGVLMATRLASLERWASHLGRPAWWALLGVAVVLMTNSWLVAGHDPQSRLRLAWIGIGSVGAVLLVFIAAFWPAARAFLRSRPVHWLGRISFSLYLVQEPVVVGLAFATGGREPLWAALALGVGAALLAGWAFHVVVERPSHRLARSLGGRSRSRALAPAGDATGATRAAAQPAVGLADRLPAPDVS